MKKALVFAVFALITSLVLVSCSRSTDVAAVKKTIEEMGVMSADAMKTGDIEKSVMQYADDATSMPPNGPALKGKAAIKAWSSQMSKMAKMTAVKFTTLDVDAAGHIAYEVGTYDMTMEMPGMGSMKDNGKYVAIWKQLADGSWKVHADIWNSNNPPHEMSKDMKKATSKKEATKKPAAKKTTAKKTAKK